MNQKMRKIYSFAVAAVAMFSAVSCNNEILQETSPVGETVVYTASTDADEVKTVLNEQTRKSEWVAGDAITVHDGTRGWKFTTEGEGSRADFSNSEGFGEYRSVMAVYPYGEWSANVAEKTVNAYIPTWQQAQAGTYHKDAALAVAYSDNSSFAFKYATALLKFTAKTENMTHVVFCGNDSQAITGNVKITLGAEGVDVTCLETDFKEKQWDEESQTEAEVIVKKYATWVECYAYHDEEHKYFENGETYYIAVAPQVFEGGVSLKIRINEGEEITVKSTAETVETKAGVILDLGDIEYEAPVVHEWAIAGTFNGWNTTANPMELVDGYYVAKNVTGLNFTAKDTDPNSSDTGFQFVNNGAWKGGEGKVTAATWAYVWNENGGNIYVEGATAETAYDIYLNPTPDAGGGIKFVVVEAGQEMPEDVVAEEEVVVGYWAVTGTMNDWGDYAELTLDGDWHVATEVKLTKADQFKLRADGDWGVNRGAAEGEDGVVIENNVETAVVQGGKNFSVAENGMYSVYINKSATIVKVVRTGDIPLPSVKNWGIVGTITQWGENNNPDIPMVLNGDWYIASGVEMPAGTQFKFRVDGKWASNGGEELTYGGTVMSGTEYSVGAGSSNIMVTSGAIYDVYLSHDETKMKVVKVGDLPDPAIMAKDGYVYLLPNSNWNQAGARFAIYFYGNGDTWVSMTKVEGTSYYGAKISDIISKGYTNLIFCRMNPANAGNDWNNKWNQTGNLNVSDFKSGKNCFTVPSNSWDGATASWSTVDKLN